MLTNITPCRFFQPSISWWSFTRVWMTTNLLRSPGLFSVFFPVSTMLYFDLNTLIIIIIIEFFTPASADAFSLDSEWHQVASDLYYFVGTSVSRRSFTGAWVTASRLKSPALFSVFWLIATILYFDLNKVLLLVLLYSFCEFFSHQC